MFEDFAGLPMHTLAVHAAVVFVPLLALAAGAYVLVPKLRPRLGWVAALLAVVAPAAAVVARLSGDAFLQRRGFPREGLVGDHATYGEQAMWATLALGVLTLTLLTVGRPDRRRVPRRVIGTLVVVAAVAAVVLVVLAGDAGARSVWESQWQLSR